MRISVTTYVRNGITMDYPYIESIKSALDLADEYIVVVGDSDDGTREKVEALNSPKIKIVDTVWDFSIRSGGKLFALQADIGTAHATGDWVLHLQADEVLHEKDIATLRAAMEQYEGNDRVEGILLPFLNFHGDYQHIAVGRSSYRFEVKCFKRKGCVMAYRDSQGFRKHPSKEAHAMGKKGGKLRVIKIDVPVFHYPNVRPPLLQTAKSKALETCYHDDAYIEKKYPQEVDFDYNEIDQLIVFKDSHPAVMRDRITGQDWDFLYYPSKCKVSFRYRVLNVLEAWTGHRIGEYKNFKLVKP